MGIGQSIQESEIKHFDIIVEETGLSGPVVKRLYKRFMKLDSKKDGFLRQEDVRELDKLNLNPLCDQIVGKLFNFENKIEFRTFVQRVALFYKGSDSVQTVFNTTEQKAAFLYSLYDLELTDNITEGEIYRMLRTMIGPQISKEQLKDIIDQIFIEMKPKNPREISYEEFVEALEWSNLTSEMYLRSLDD